MGVGTESLRVEYAGARVGLSAREGTHSHLDQLVRFIQPHMDVSGHIGPVHVDVELRSINGFVPPDRASRQTLLRRGRTAERHVWAEEWHVNGATLLYIPASRTAFRLSNDGTTAIVWTSDESRYHLSDFMRDTVWELALATGEGFFIHAAAVVTPNDEVIAIVGDKGAGKTTTAIDLLHHGAKMFSGDVTFVDGSDGSVRGFPDYPGVCWGTLRSFPQLVEKVREMGAIDAGDDDKVLLPHDVYEIALGVVNGVPPLPLGAIIVGEVQDAGASRLEPGPARVDLLKPMVRRTTDPDQGWEPFLAAVRKQASASSSVPVTDHIVRRWYRRAGRGNLPADQVRTLLRSHDDVVA